MNQYERLWSEQFDALDAALKAEDAIQTQNPKSERVIPQEESPADGSRHHPGKRFWVLG